MSQGSPPRMKIAGLFSGEYPGDFLMVIILSLPPRAPLLTRVRLIDAQSPSSERRPLQPGNSRLGFCGVWHLDKAKTPRAAGVPILDDLDALDDAIRCKQLAQLFFGRRKGFLAWQL